MAELALGLTKTVLDGAISRIQSALDEEGKLQEGVAQDLPFIIDEFQMMQAVLKVAKKEREKKNEVVRTWVRQLRDLAFDVEDWVELAAHMNKDVSVCAGLLRVMPSWAVPRCLQSAQRDLDEAAAMMKLLKSRVENVSLRTKRYNLFISNDSGSSSGLDSVAVTPMTTADLSSSVFLSLLQVWNDQTDRLRYVESLQNLITREVGGDDLEVIWLWGGEDPDASYEIGKAYHDQEICQWFDRRAWVKIAHPFIPQEFLGTLLAQLMPVGSSHQATNGLTSIELVRQVTKEQRYLVVLEQVSDLVEWNSIQMYLPDNKMGSRILVSTQNLGLAAFCTGYPYLVSVLRWLPHGRRSLCAVYRKVAGRSDSDMDILIGKIKRGGVISVCGDGPRKSRIVKTLYHRIMQNSGNLVGIRFKSLRWVRVVGHPFDLLDFSRRVLLALDWFGFYDGDLQELFDIFGGPIFEKVLTKMKEEDMIKASRELLRNVDIRLFVIDGLRSKDDWDVIQHSTILPDSAKCCVIVVTDDPGVASYCVDGIEDRVVRTREADMRLPPGSIFSCKRERAIDWIRSISDRYLSRRRKIYEDLINNRMTARSPPVVAVWGIAGVGKTTLVQWFFNKNMLSPEKMFPNFCHYCGVIVPHPFNLAELSQLLILQFLEDYPPREGAMVRIIERSQDPIEECRMWLRENAEWLLVLDGLRSTDEWDTVNSAFCLSKPTRGSRIIVITNEQRVAMHCVNKDDKQVISVQGLDADESLHLFNQKVHNNKTGMELSDMDRVSELPTSIMAKCGGLPKVIAAVAEYYNESLDRRKLKDINDNFMQILEGVHSLSGLFSWMQSYLETCKDDLKPCIFYLPIFPIGHNIRSRRLLQRWIAEGYFRGTSSHTAEEIGIRLMTELWEFSMIQHKPSSKPDQCQVNGFFHEYITSRPLEDNLVFALEGNCRLSSQQVGQHLTVRNIKDTDKNVYESTDFSRLRSLTVFGECRPFMFDPEKIKLRHVRVLDLEDASGVRNIDLHHIVEMLPRLKFLSIRGCREVTHLPKSLGGLRQLQTLDVRHTSIVKLPEAILNLEKLHYVRAGTTAPWDEGGIMVICPLAAPGEDTPKASMTPAEENTVLAVAPTARVEDDTIVVAAPTSLVKDAPTASRPQAVAIAAPMDLGEDAPMASTAPAEDVVAAATEPVEDAPTASRQQAEDRTVDVATQMAPGEDTPTASTTQAEDITVAVAAPTAPIEDAATASTAPSEDDATPMASAEGATTVAADPSAPEINATIGAAAPPGPAENVVTIKVSPADDSTTAAAASRSRPHALVPRWLDKLCCRSRPDNASHGIEVPAAIGKLMNLQTFGVANVGPRKGGILKELYKLTQLRRLGACGISLHNIHEFFSAIKGLNHLEQLSVRLDKNKDGLIASLDGTIALPPKTLDVLKLHGHVRILPDSWIKEFVNVENLNLEVTLQEEQDMQVILGHVIDHRNARMTTRLCIKPIYDGELRIGRNNEQMSRYLEVLEIVCTSDLQATFGEIGHVELVKVHCSSRSSLQLSGLQEIEGLEEVWLKGSYSDELKQDMQRQLAQHKDKPVMKIFQPRSS